MFPSSPFVKVFLGFLILIGSMAAQAPRPRIAFTQADIPALQARIGLPGPVGTAYNSMVSSAVFQSNSTQAHFYIQRSLRRMHELAVKYQLTQNVAFGENAKTLLLAARNSLTPTGTTAYVLTTYPSVMGVTFDLIYDLLTPAERASIVSHLEAWVTAMRVGTGGVGGYTAYSAAVDNYSFSWCTGIALTLMAIEGDSSYPNLQGLIQTNLQMIRTGWLDAVSPDGSIDESFGYANYGAIAAINAGIAAENCGYGDIISGTNILKTPRWYGSSLNSDTLLWHGDSSASHKGTRLDPTIHAVLQRTNDSEGLWALNCIFAIEPPSDNSPCHGWSPHVNMFLRYPVTVVPQEPRVVSAFFRDNLNEGTAVSNRNAAYTQLGMGGHAMMHNSAPSSAWQKLTNYYMIRDEWMSHAHEDDGHFSVGVGGFYQFLDQGYSGPTFLRAQSTDHNIVVVSGVTGFAGNSTNYYNPPSTTNGRYMGKVERRFFSEGMDYVRGSHEFMWMMNEAQRSVVMIKDAQAPYSILMDRVSKDSQSRTYQQLFHSSGPASGQGTVQSPMLVTGGGATLRSSWLAPTGAQLVPGTAITSGSAVAYKHIVQATGADVSFVSIHGATSPSSSQPLVSPHANTVGGHLQWNGYSDCVLVQRTAGVIGDANTSADARWVWIRSGISGALDEWSAGEATQITYMGANLLSSSAPVEVSVRHGRVELGGAPASTLSATLFVPYGVTAVTVDGINVPFHQVGTEVQIGPNAGQGFVLPVRSTDDRAYSFLSGLILDGVPSSNAFVTSGEKLTSSGGVATFGLKNLDTVGTRPFSVAMDVSFLPGAGFQEAGFKFHGAQDLQIAVAPQSALSALVVISREGTPLGTCEVSYDSLGIRARLDVELRPATGTLEVRDALGALQLTVTTTLASSYTVDAFVTPYAFLDNITLFDSAEDGVTPQGIVFYNDAQGVAGFNVRAPALTSMQDLAVIHNGQRVEIGSAIQWAVLGQLAEVVITGHSSALPVSTREAGWEFGVSAVYTAGHQTGIFIRTAAGVPLFGVQPN